MVNLCFAEMWVLELGVEVLMSRLRVLVDSVMERDQLRATSSTTCHVIEKNELTGGLSPVPPLSPNSFSTTVFVLAYIDLTKSKNGSTNGSASSYSISLFTSAKMATDLMSPEPINHDFDTDQCILLILGFDQFDHQTHHTSFEWFEWIGMR